MAGSTLEDGSVGIKGIVSSLVFPGEVFSLVPVLVLPDDHDHHDDGNEEESQEYAQDGRVGSVVQVLDLLLVDIWWSAGLLLLWRQGHGFDAAEVFSDGLRRGLDVGQRVFLEEQLEGNDFIELDSQYEFKIKRQEETTCKGVSLDTESVADFQSYMRRFNFTRQRCAYLYGTFTEENKVVVEAMYEPPQEAGSIK